MKLLLSIVEELSSLILDHYGNTLKGIIIGGEAIDEADERKPLLILLLLDKTHRISFYAREDIAEYFIKKVEKSKNYFDYVSRYGKRPLLYFLILDPIELQFHNPITLYLLSKGRILLDREKLLEGERSKINVTSFQGMIKYAEINKGDVIEV